MIKGSLNFNRTVFRFSNRAAFTLPEVLITLGIIGVVAAVIMPTLLQNVSERVYSHREANIANKITNAMEVMITSGNYSSYSTTEEFVNALKKHLKIIKVCDNGHLTDCWPTAKVKGADGNEYNVADVTTGRKLHTKNNTNTVGIVLNDGASLILTYNPNVIPENDMASFIPSTKKLPVGFGKKKEFAYTSNATDAIDYVVDVNGSSGPNAETDEGETSHDIRSFKRASFSAVSVCEGYKINGACFVDLGVVAPISCVEGVNTEYCLTSDGNNSGYLFDYWAGANKACDDIGMSLVPASILLNDLIKQHIGEEGVPNSGWYWTSTTRGLYQGASVVDHVKAQADGYNRDWTYRYSTDNKTICYSY